MSDYPNQLDRAMDDIKEEMIRDIIEGSMSSLHAQENQSPSLDSAD